MRKHSDPPLIGLVGPAGSGKDTVAGLLCEHHGFTQVAFADALREFTAAIDPTWADLVALLGYEHAKRVYPPIRERIIQIGQAAREHIDPHVWVKAAADRARTRLIAGLPVVMSDVRQRNEADFIAAQGGTLVAVERPGCPADQFPDVATLMLSADYGVTNDGSIDDLRYAVDQLVRDLALECEAA